MKHGNHTSDELGNNVNRLLGEDFFFNIKIIIMKLELKHLSAYLPYRVRLSKIHFLTFGSNEGNGIGSLIHVLDTKSNHFKMWLRPLSDLTKEIEVNGEMFIPIQWFEDQAYIDWEHIKFSDYINPLTLPYCWVNKLIEWHFDIFGLIDAGLAVDINTVTS